MSIASNWKLDFTTGVPIYKQIINWVYSEIGNGNLREGDRLPTIKELTEMLNVNPNTIAKAYRDLDMKGVLFTQRGNGCFISALLGNSTTISEGDKQVKMNEILGKLITEAKVWNITEKELLKYTKRRLKEDE